MHNKYYFIMLQKDATNVICIVVSSFLPIDEKFQGVFGPPSQLNIELYEFT